MAKATETAPKAEEKKAPLKVVKADDIKKLRDKFHKHDTDARKAQNEKDKVLDEFKALLAEENLDDKIKAAFQARLKSFKEEGNVLYRQGLIKWFDDVHKDLVLIEAGV